jgi:hypothetical protein
VGVFFIGAMPWVQLFDDDRLTGWVSVIQIDWSPLGSGRLVTIRRDRRLHMLGTSEELAAWLYEWMFQYHGDGYQPQPFRHSDIEFVVDPATGMRASADGVLIEMSTPIDRQLARREHYRLGDFAPTASWVRISCANARVVLDGVPLPGAPKLSTDDLGRCSTAQLNIAEVWTASPGDETTIPGQ